MFGMGLQVILTVSASFKVKYSIKLIAVAWLFCGSQVESQEKWSLKTKGQSRTGW